MAQYRIKSKDGKVFGILSVTETGEKETVTLQFYVTMNHHVFGRNEEFTSEWVETYNSYDHLQKRLKEFGISNFVPTGNVPENHIYIA